MKFPVRGAISILIACLLPWLLISVLILNPEIFAPSIPVLDGASLAYVVILFLIIALFLFAYEWLFFHYVAIPIIEERPEPILADEPNHERLIEGTPESIKKDRRAAEEVFQVLNETVDSLTTEKRNDQGERLGVSLRDDIRSPNEVVEPLSPRGGSAHWIEKVYLLV